MTKKNEPYHNSEYWEDRIANETWKTYNNIEEKNMDLLRVYEKSSQNIKNELLALAEKAEREGELGRSDQYRFNKLLGQQGEIFKECERLGKQIEKHAAKNMIDGGKEIYRNVMTSLGESQFHMPNKKVMERMLRSPWHGSFFSERLWKNMGKLERNLNGVISNGVSTGKTITEMAVQLSNIMQSSFNDAHRLVRTETINYLNRSELMAYKKAGISEVQWWAAEDERTCPTCGANHERKYSIDKAPILPCHPGCRCTWLPVIESTKDEEYSQVSVENSNKSGTIKVEQYHNFSSGKKVNEFFYYDGKERGRTARKESSYENWKRSLPQDSLDAIKAYSINGYESLNMYLRRHEGWRNVDAEKMEEFKKDLNFAISIFELKAPIKVYRGVSEDVFNDIVQSSAYCDKGFVSTSPTLECTYLKNKEYILDMYIPKGNGIGAYINDLSVFKDEEYEFLLRPDIEFRIIDSYEEQGKRHIRLEMIGNE